MIQEFIEILHPFLDKQLNSTYSIAVLILTLSIVALQLYKNWVFAIGKIMLTHKLNLVIFSLYIALETVVAFHDPTQRILLLMNIVSVWAFTMNLKGLLRLRKKKETK